METLPITEICRRTGLSARALRFYESRGLLTAQRSAAGQRRYGAAELARLHQITALKGAGFGLTRIGELLGADGLDLAAVIEAQLGHLEAGRRELDAASCSLKAAQAALAAGRLPDLDSFCDLIKQGARTMTDQAAWKTVADRYFTNDEQEKWADKMAAVPAGFDQNDYSAKWADLGTRIAAALPMAPASAAAQAFVKEWQVLLSPFAKVATPAMWAGASTMYDRMDEWSGDMKPPFPSDVWGFIKAASGAKAG
ncbi:MerR family transcriptional regulator [Sphingosinicellaceae bacterium]|nr:MerR family transcriptional regulator [Sphingosinicellaceae bacterium]